MRPVPSRDCDCVQLKYCIAIAERVVPCIRQSATNVEEAQDVRWIKETKAKHAAGIQNPVHKGIVNGDRRRTVYYVRVL